MRERKFLRNKNGQASNFRWLVDFGFNGHLRQYFSLYQVISQREGDRGE